MAVVMCDEMAGFTSPMLRGEFADATWGAFFLPSIAGSFGARAVALLSLSCTLCSQRKTMKLIPSRTFLMAVSLLAGMTDFSEPMGMLDADVNYNPAMETLEPHFNEPIGQVRAAYRESTDANPFLLHGSFSCQVRWGLLPACTELCFLFFPLQIQRQFFELTLYAQRRWNRVRGASRRSCNRTSGHRS